MSRQCQDNVGIQESLPPDRGTDDFQGVKGCANAFEFNTTSCSSQRFERLIPLGYLVGYIRKEAVATQLCHWTKITTYDAVAS